jgi:hypothetical protein
MIIEHRASEASRTCERDVVEVRMIRKPCLTKVGLILELGGVEIDGSREYAFPEIRLLYKGGFLEVNRTTSIEMKVTWLLALSSWISEVKDLEESFDVLSIDDRASCHDWLAGAPVISSLGEFGIDGVGDTKAIPKSGSIASATAAAPDIEFR